MYSDALHPSAKEQGGSVASQQEINAKSSSCSEKQDKG